MGYQRKIGHAAGHSLITSLFITTLTLLDRNTLQTLSTGHTPLSPGLNEGFPLFIDPSAALNVRETLQVSIKVDALDPLVTNTAVPHIFKHSTTVSHI